MEIYITPLILQSLPSKPGDSGPPSVFPVTLVSYGQCNTANRLRPNVA